MYLFVPGPLDVADVSVFLQKINIFSKNSSLTQSNSMRAMLEVF